MEAYSSFSARVVLEEGGSACGKPLRQLAGQYAGERARGADVGAIDFVARGGRVTSRVDLHMKLFFGRADSASGLCRRGWGEAI